MRSLVQVSHSQDTPIESHLEKTVSYTYAEALVENSLQNLLSCCFAGGLLDKTLEEGEALREVVIFTALRPEMSPLKALLSSRDRLSRDIPIHIGQMEGKRVILVSSGVGGDRSLRAAELSYSRHNPDGVLSTGFCGGLVPELQPSDVVLSSWVVSEAAGSRLNMKQLVLGDKAVPLQTVLTGEGIRAYMGGFVCVSRPVVSPTEKRALAHRTGAMVVEMETFHLGEFFLSRNVPFLGMRTVVDGLNDRIPRLKSTMMMAGRPRPVDILRHLIFHPHGALDLWRLYENGRRAQVALRRSVGAVIRVWP